MSGMDHLLSLDGKSALVTGAAGGIGSAVVSMLVKAGARVMSVDLPGAGIPPGSESFPCDLASRDEIQDLFRRVKETNRSLDLVVHCAGIHRDQVLWKMPLEAWRDVMSVNLDSAFHIIGESVPMMRDAGGAIVVVSSINGERGKFGQANYAASKAGLIGLARTAARELGRFGIRVNVVAPGMIRTSMTGSLPPAVVEEALEEAVLGRLGEPDDVASAILFLCSNMSRHVTGQVLRVDGGQLIA
jgi:acetoacetyl-CoA reductase/3-oxoacyl-[acyl-carrier protein] reductase